MVYGLVGDTSSSVHGNRISGIRVGVVFRGIAARYLDSNTVMGQKSVPYVEKLDLILRNLVGRNRLRMIVTGPIACADDADARTER